MPGPCCGSWDLRSSLRTAGSLVGQVESFFLLLLFWLWHDGSLTRDRSQIPCTGSTVLVTGPPGKPLNRVLMPRMEEGYVPVGTHCSQNQNSSRESGQVLNNIEPVFCLPSVR